MVSFGFNVRKKDPRVVSVQLKNIKSKLDSRLSVNDYYDFWYSLINII